jgi:hypothetical protein
MSDLGRGGEQVHRSGDGVAPSLPAPAIGLVRSPVDGEAIMNTERELTINELDAVSGGLLNAAIAGAIAGAAKGLGPHDDGVLPTLPCDSFDIICRILS